MMEYTMASVFDIGLPWRDSLCIVVITWSQLVGTRLITGNSRCPARPRLWVDVRLVTDPLAWAMMRGFLRAYGKAPPVWLLWAITCSVSLIATYACDQAVSNVFGVAPLWR